MVALPIEWLRDADAVSNLFLLHMQQAAHKPAAAREGKRRTGRPSVCPGATGNTATEDAVWMFRRMGVDTGVDLAALRAVASRAAALPGASPGGRVRGALAGAVSA